MMKKISLNLLMVTLVSFLFGGCFKTDQNPDVPWVEPAEVALTGSGSLQVGVGEDAVTTNSTYSWSLDGTTIQIDINVDLDQYVNGDDVISGGAWEIGNFTLSSSTVNDFLGIFVSELDETTFYAVNSDGSVVEEMTSYKPGMWVDADGFADNWSTGVMFWQWYVWGGKTDQNGDEIGYDYDYETYPGLFFVGSNPSNVMAVAGDTVTSKAKLVKGDVVYDWIVNVVFVESSLTGSGTLVQDMGESAVTTNSSYSWRADETGISLTFDVDLQEYINSGYWDIGGFKLDIEALNNFYGADFGNTTISTFYPVEPGGASGTSWTSYSPGQWVATDGSATDYSSGAMFWQWYIYSSTTYDYGYTGNEGYFLLGSNPGNASSLANTSVVSKAAFVVDGTTYSWTVTVNYGEGEVPAENYPNVPMTGSGYPYPYSCGVSGENQFSWYTDANGIYIFADIYSTTVINDGAWEIMGFVIDPEELSTAFGINAASWDISTFYPVEPDGTAGSAWTSYTPGQWVASDGTASDWSAGSLYWQYQVNGVYYDGHSTEGLLIIGTNPGNISALDGQTVVSKAKFFGMDWIVNVTYHNSYPTSGTGNVGAHTYSWALTSTGVNIIANCSSALTDESWNWFGFPLNEIYINNYYGINIDDLSGSITPFLAAASTDGFYPINSASERLANWTSYAPGMWFGADGNPWSWDYASWGNFWQYYTVVEHDYAIPNLMLFGNWGDKTYSISGTSGTSKAILNGTLEWNVTINIVD